MAMVRSKNIHSKVPGVLKQKGAKMILREERGNHSFKQLFEKESASKDTDEISPDLHEQEEEKEDASKEADEWAEQYIASLQEQQADQGYGKCKEADEWVEQYKKRMNGQNST
jgi:hypothetical protein